ncbi:hypothetical protein ACLMJK_006137 [Lecanora helva]
MSNTREHTHAIAFLLFQGADILDLTGPLEILSSIPNTPTSSDLSQADFAFETHLVARAPTIAASGRGCITVATDSTVDEAIKRVAEFDILVVPGGNVPIMQDLAKTNTPEVQFIQAFDALPPKQDGDERVILSVCTGALLLAAAGVLKGLRATTHHKFLDVMKAIDTSIDVLGPEERAVGRYVDGGRNGNGTRVLTAGGVTCGLDASLYVAELKAGKPAAEYVAMMTEHEWKRA